MNYTCKNHRPKINKIRKRRNMKKIIETKQKEARQKHPDSSFKNLDVYSATPKTAPDSAAPDTATASDYDGLVHLADPDVQVAADGADFPSVVKCLQLCKLPYDGSANWQDLEGKDVLRAVRRFRLRFPAVSWTFAEDYIFTVFGKKKSEKTRGGKRSENNKAEKIGLPNPHTFRPQKNSKASKAAAAAAVATAEESESPTDFTSSAPTGIGTSATLDPDLAIAIPAPDAQVVHHMEAPALLWPMVRMQPLAMTGPPDWGLGEAYGPVLDGVVVVVLLLFLRQPRG
ncbi:Protein of unknown function [Pyronema omphalodes CBS 100304]|uniref:Uncharacterized protein n=1 Tax=Pyronema omphalodes (strain CBS 100304) TaxID=1076935 RepID=U4KYW0_PYROM|nr:Protein of unknown function [Pyronema omphalodes CBS 100304]